MTDHGLEPVPPVPVAVAVSLVRAPDEPLSQREMECLRMVARGLTDTRAARMLGISHSTVRFHLHNACVKLGAPNRCAAIYRAAKDNRI